MTTDLRIELTEAERRAIARVKRAFKGWPDTLWLFVASDTVHVMRKGRRGEQVMGCGRKGEGVDPRYSLDTIDVEASGGDW